MSTPCRCDTRFAARVLAAFVRGQYGFAGSFNNFPLFAINRQRNGNRQRRERPQSARHDKKFLRGGDTAFRAFTGDKSKAHGKETIAAERVAGRGVAAMTPLGHQHVGEPSLFLRARTVFQTKPLRVGKVAPFFLFGGRRNFFQLPQQPNPQSLNLNRITFARVPAGKFVSIQVKWLGLQMSAESESMRMPFSVPRA